MTDAQTDRQHLEAIVAAIDQAHNNPPVVNVVQDLLDAANAAKQHLDTTKPDDGGVAESSDTARYVRMIASGLGGAASTDDADVAKGYAAAARHDLLNLAERLDNSPNEAEIRADERRRIDEILRELHRRWDEVHIRFDNFGGDDELCEVRLFEWPDAEQEGDGSWSAASPGSSKEYRAATLPEVLEAATQSIQAEAGGPENG